MITSINISNFKSFKSATAHLRRVNFLIGPNASGKSNFLEGVRLLGMLARGFRIDDLEQIRLFLRGNARNFFADGRKPIGLGCEIEDAEWNRLETRLKYKNDGLFISEEVIRSNRDANLLYQAKAAAGPSGRGLVVRCKNPAPHRLEVMLSCSRAGFSQLDSPPHSDLSNCIKKMSGAAEKFRTLLKNIIFLAPDPAAMRGYSSIGEDRLGGNAANISAALYRLCFDAAQKQKLLDFARSLPEQNLTDIAFIKTARNDVMLQLGESFGGRTRLIEAALLSDGTLRALAVAAIMLSAPVNSLIVVEEIDNGIHPARVGLLVDNIYRLAQERDLQILATTHNPALLDAIPERYWGDTLYCYRDVEDGTSKLISLSEVPHYPALTAAGTLGEMICQGLIDRNIKKSANPESRTQMIGDLLDMLNAANT